MAVTIHVNGKTNSLVHKGSMGIAKSTIPDVCKTPSPGGPVPIPYPIIVSMSSDLKKGTKTVKVDGKKMAAVKGSEFSRCTGDEPGTAGGGVKSSTNMKEATWILYSFDVKMDGKNSCRLSDKMMMNHGNTACLNGTVQMPVPVLSSCTKKGLDKLADDCNKNVNCDKKKGGPCPESSPSGHDCTTLGTKKHKCCEDAIKKHSKENPECGIQSEVAFDKDTGKPLDKDKASEARSEANKKYNAHKKEHGIESARKNKVWIKAFSEAGGSNTFIADVIMDNPKAAYDFKFNCKPVGDNPMERMNDTQFDNYKTYTGVEPEVIAADGRDCSGCK